MLGRASVDAHRLAIKTQLADVAGGTGNIQKLFFTARSTMARPRQSRARISNSTREMRRKMNILAGL
ncbi:hypothetical protein PS723_03929 [Pseudomonas fluorescens]|uniref:Uncharacterized protein n=1 Tax=Pseudomonas fluorescens TaxID=294 RepID=A0A5E7DL83_PSEFL|nr:hypothetical protein PS723_03929 [Pseudomonas fluorescens]